MCEWNWIEFVSKCVFSALTKLQLGGQVNSRCGLLNKHTFLAETIG